MSLAASVGRSGARLSQTAPVTRPQEPFAPFSATTRSQVRGRVCVGGGGTARAPRSSANWPRVRVAEGAGVCSAIEHLDPSVPASLPVQVFRHQSTLPSDCLVARVRVRVANRHKGRQLKNKHGDTQTSTQTHSPSHLVVGPRLAHGAWRGRACVRARRGSEAGRGAPGVCAVDRHTHSSRSSARALCPSQSATESLASRGDEEGGARLRLPHTDRPSALRERQQRQTRTSTQPGAAPRAPTNAAEACHTRCGTGTVRDGRRGQPRRAPPTPAACVR